MIVHDTQVLDESLPDAAIPPPHKQHFLALDGLRGIAAIAVLIYHRRWWVSDDSVFIQHAYLAVDFFFMLSGLVVALAYEQRLRYGRMRLRDFALLRAIRLYPLIVLGAILGAAFLGFKALLAHDASSILRTAAALPLAAAVLPIPPQLFNQPFALNEPSWSLFFELWANLVFAAVAPLLSRRALGLAIVIFGAALVAVSVHSNGLAGGWLWANLHVGAIRVGFSFVVGVALLRWLKAGRLPGWSLPFWVLGLLLIACFAPSLPITGWNAGYDIAMVMIVFPLIIVMGCNCRSGGAWTPIMTISGELSYPVYIIHYSILWWIEAAMWRLGLPNWVMLITAIVVTLPVALLLSRFYDEPIRRRLRNWYATQRWP